MNPENKDVAKSIFAVQQYIALNEENKYRHTANVLINIYKKDYSCQSAICATANDDFASVIIEDLHTVCNVSLNEFSIQNSSFAFISRTLCIKARGKLGEDIMINIT